MVSKPEAGLAPLPGTRFKSSPPLVVPASLLAGLVGVAVEGTLGLLLLGDCCDSAGRLIKALRLAAPKKPAALISRVLELFMSIDISFEPQLRRIIL
jgi:hypothetical protein